MTQKDIPWEAEKCTWCPNAQYHKNVCIKEKFGPCYSHELGVQLFYKIGKVAGWAAMEGFYCPVCLTRIDK